MVRNACLTSLYAIGSKKPPDSRYSAHTRNGCWSVLYGGNVPENCLCHGTLAVPTFLSTADGVITTWSPTLPCCWTALISISATSTLPEKSSQALSTAGALPPVSPAEATPSAGDATLARSVSVPTMVPARYGTPS